jgi:hypothetical protein
MDLKYLFNVEFKDGSIYQQTPEDVSIEDPMRSSFYDVQKRLAEIKKFELCNAEYSVLVDLETGEFDINNTIKIPSNGEVINRRLIYFRRHRHDYNISMLETSHEMSFHIGWQGNDPITNENVQKTLILI